MQPQTHQKILERGKKEEKKKKKKKKKTKKKKRIKRKKRERKRRQVLWKSTYPAIRILGHEYHERMTATAERPQFWISAYTVY